jgi:hypothetical protein
VGSFYYQLCAAMAFYDGWDAYLNIDTKYPAGALLYSRLTDFLFHARKEYTTLELGGYLHELLLQYKSPRIPTDEKKLLGEKLKLLNGYLLWVHGVFARVEEKHRDAESVALLHQQGVVDLQRTIAQGPPAKVVLEEAALYVRQHFGTIDFDTEYTRYGSSLELLVNARLFTWVGPDDYDVPMSHRFFNEPLLKLVRLALATNTSLHNKAVARAVLRVRWLIYHPNKPLPGPKVDSLQYLSELQELSQADADTETSKLQASLLRDMSYPQGDSPTASRLRRYSGSSLNSMDDTDESSASIQSSDTMASTQVPPPVRKVKYRGIATYSADKLDFPGAAAPRESLANKNVGALAVSNYTLQQGYTKLPGHKITINTGEDQHWLALVLFLWDQQELGQKWLRAWIDTGGNCLEYDGTTSMKGSTDEIRQTYQRFQTVLSSYVPQNESSDLLLVRLKRAWNFAVQHASQYNVVWAKATVYPSAEDSDVRPVTVDRVQPARTEPVPLRVTRSTTLQRPSTAETSQFPDDAGVPMDTSTQSSPANAVINHVATSATAAGLGNVEQSQQVINTRIEHLVEMETKANDARGAEKAAQGDVMAISQQLIARPSSSSIIARAMNNNPVAVAVLDNAIARDYALAMQHAKENKYFDTQEFQGFFRAFADFQNKANTKGIPPQELHAAYTRLITTVSAYWRFALTKTFDGDQQAQFIAAELEDWLTALVISRDRTNGSPEVVVANTQVVKEVETLRKLLGFLRQFPEANLVEMAQDEASGKLSATDRKLFRDIRVQVALASTDKGSSNVNEQVRDSLLSAIDNLLLELYPNHSTYLLNEQDAKDARKALDAEKGKVQQLTAGIQQLQGEREAMMAGIQKAQADRDAANERRELALRTLREREKAIGGLTNQVAALTQELSNAQARVTEAEKQINYLVGHVAALQSEVKGLQEDVRQREEAIAKLQNELRNATRAPVDVNMNHDEELQKVITRLTAERDGLQKQVQEVTAKLAYTQQELVNLRGQYELEAGEANKQIAGLEAKIQELLTEGHRVTNENTALHTQVTNLQTEVKTLKDALAARPADPPAPVAPPAPPTPPLRPARPTGGGAFPDLSRVITTLQATLAKVLAAAKTSADASVDLQKANATILDQLKANSTKFADVDTKLVNQYNAIQRSLDGLTLRAAAVQQDMESLRDAVTTLNEKSDHIGRLLDEHLQTQGAIHRENQETFGVLHDVLQGNAEQLKQVKDFLETHGGLDNAAAALKQEMWEQKLDTVFHEVHQLAANVMLTSVPYTASDLTKALRDHPEMLAVVAKAAADYLQTGLAPAVHQTTLRSLANQAPTEQTAAPSAPTTVLHTMVATNQPPTGQVLQQSADMLTASTQAQVELNQKIQDLETKLAHATTQNAKLRAVVDQIRNSAVFQAHAANWSGRSLDEINQTQARARARLQDPTALPLAHPLAMQR